MAQGYSIAQHVQTDMATGVSTPRRSGRISIPDSTTGEQPGLFSKTRWVSSHQPCTALCFEELNGGHGLPGLGPKGPPPTLLQLKTCNQELASGTSSRPEDLRFWCLIEERLFLFSLLHQPIESAQNAGSSETVLFLLRPYFISLYIHIAVRQNLKPPLPNHGRLTSLTKESVHFQLSTRVPGFDPQPYLSHLTLSFWIGAPTHRGFPPPYWHCPLFLQGTACIVLNLGMEGLPVEIRPAQNPNNKQLWRHIRHAPVRRASLLHFARLDHHRARRRAAQRRGTRGRGSS